MLIVEINSCKRRTFPFGIVYSKIDSNNSFRKASITLLASFFELNCAMYSSPFTWKASLPACLTSNRGAGQDDVPKLRIYGVVRTLQTRKID